jgi:hypothetical protein
MEVAPRIDEEGTDSQWVRRWGISPFSRKEHKSHEMLVKEECQALSTGCIQLSTPGVQRWGLRFPVEMRRARCGQWVNREASMDGWNNIHRLREFWTVRV